MTTTPAYTVTFDACEDGYSWHVTDADGDTVDSFETEADAVADAAERNEADERENIITAIADAVDSLDLATLRRLMKVAGL